MELSKRQPIYPRCERGDCRRRRCPPHCEHAHSGADRARTVLGRPSETPEQPQAHHRRPRAPSPPAPTSSSSTARPRSQLAHHGQRPAPADPEGKGAQKDPDQRPLGRGRSRCVHLSRLITGACRAGTGRLRRAREGREPAEEHWELTLCPVLATACHPRSDTVAHTPHLDLDSPPAQTLAGRILDDSAPKRSGAPPVPKASAPAAPAGGGDDDAPKPQQLAGIFAGVGMPTLRKTGAPVASSLGGSGAAAAGACSPPSVLSTRRAS